MTKILIVEDDADINNAVAEYLTARGCSCVQAFSGTEGALQWRAHRPDLVVADLPCSGLGVLGRKPDIKWRVTPESLDSLAGLQRQILSVVWQYVKPGGILIYSTCTINRKENEDNRDWFLGQFPFRPVSLEGRLGEKLNAETLKEGYIQLLPGIWPCDGFFLSVMQRI